MPYLSNRTPGQTCEIRNHTSRQIHDIRNHTSRQTYDIRNCTPRQTYHDIFISRPLTMRRNEVSTNASTRILRITAIQLLANGQALVPIIVISTSLRLKRNVTEVVRIVNISGLLIIWNYPLLAYSCVDAFSAISTII